MQGKEEGSKLEKEVETTPAPPPRSASIRELTGEAESEGQDVGAGWPSPRIRAWELSSSKKRRIEVLIACTFS